MNQLTLYPGPRLILREYAPEPGDAQNQPDGVDMTRCAHGVLNEPIVIDPATTLNDVFKLLEASPLLKLCYFRQEAEALCAAARQAIVESESLDDGTSEARKMSSSCLFPKYDFLELYQVWFMMSSEGRYSDTQHLHLHGVGRQVWDDATEKYIDIDARIEYSVVCTPLGMLLSLPLVLKPKVRVFESDFTAKAYNDLLKHVQRSDVSLGQVLYGLLWELSNHGAPRQEEEFVDELQKSLDDTEARHGEVVSIDAGLEEFFGHGCRQLFEVMGGQSARTLARLITKEIDDDADAAAWIEHAFDGEVVLKAQLHNSTGRELRRAFWYARYSGRTGE